MAKNQDGYLSAKESRRISKENRRITNQFEKAAASASNVPESEYHHPDAGPQPTRWSSITCTPTSSPTPASVKSVDGVSFEVPIGKTVGVVGESGCGKSVTSLSLMQLLAAPPGPDRRGRDPAESRQ